MIIKISLIVLLKCNSAYPAPYEDSNLKTISDFKERFNVIPGYSDHTIGTHCAIASVPLGAKLIEKHFYIKGIEIVDSFFSISPDEFKDMVTKVRDLEKALGSVSYEVSNSAKESINGRRSIYVSKNIKPGDKINRNNIKCIRPSFGIEPKYLNKVLGKTARKQLKKGDRLAWDVIE